MTIRLNDEVFGDYLKSPQYQEIMTCNGKGGKKLLINQSIFTEIIKQLSFPTLMCHFKFTVVAYDCLGELRTLKWHQFLQNIYKEINCAQNTGNTAWKTNKIK